MAGLGLSRTHCLQYIQPTYIQTDRQLRLHGVQNALKAAFALCVLFRPTPNQPSRSLFCDIRIINAWRVCLCVLQARNIMLKSTGGGGRGVTSKVG